MQEPTAADRAPSPAPPAVRPSRWHRAHLRSWICAVGQGARRLCWRWVWGFSVVRWAGCSGCRKRLAPPSRRSLGLYLPRGLSGHSWTAGLLGTQRRIQILGGWVLPRPRLPRPPSKPLTPATRDASKRRPACCAGISQRSWTRLMSWSFRSAWWSRALDLMAARRSLTGRRGTAAGL